ncbi:MAG: hypothetical protein M3R48_02945 [Candidatus Dormibacteraeota bacterium]|nr:hypothetical protein [Candidatus Dormibacteraeota bacterium]
MTYDLHAIIPPTDRLQPDSTQFQCPECGRGCYIGFRAGRGVTFRCTTDGSFYGITDTGQVVPGERPLNHMNPEERLWLLSSACQVLLEGFEDGNFLVAQSTTVACNYVMLRVLGGGLWAEVCSRDRGCQHCGDRPLTSEAVAALTAMGFSIPGPRENPERWVTTRAPRELAVIGEHALMAAYAEQADVEIAVFMAREGDMGSLAESLSIPARLS